MSLTVTLTILLLALAVAGFANWRERRPRALGRPPLISYTALQMVALVVVILMLAHLVSLLSGQPLTGRLMR
jgi:uncharacterized iron-regulated membrane protein